MCRTTLSHLLLTLPLLLPFSTSARAQDCPVALTGDLLNEKLPEIKAAMPRRFETTQRNGFLVPSGEDRVVWTTLIAAFIGGDLDGACNILTANAYPYQVIVYGDLTTGKTYHLLQEQIPPDAPIATGWGTYISNPASASGVVIEVPHPLFDTLTPEEGVDAFRQLDARALLLAGTHRYANGIQSTCQPDPTVVGNEADAAHNVATMFEPAHETIAGMLPDTVFVQLHGNDNATCRSAAAFVSNGTITPGPAEIQLVNALTAAGFPSEAAVPESTCTLKGTTNVQGRFTNGSQDLCFAPADTATERFLHIEQSSTWDLRAAQNRQVLIDALRVLFAP